MQNMTRLFSGLTAAAACLALTTSCGRETSINGSGYDSKNKASADAHAEGPHSSEQEHQFDEQVVPPQEYYDALFAQALNQTDEQKFSLAQAEQILFINFEGATIAKGYGREQSFIPCKQSSTIPPAQLSPADKQAVVDSVQAFYNAAGALLRVTTEKPSAGEFTTIHTGGSYADLGCAGAGILGVAPFDQGNANRSDIGFAFTKNTNSNRIIAETIAHEAGHSFGLEHVESRKDLMYFSSTNEITGFTASRVSGRAKTQDAPALLIAALGSGTATAGTVVAGGSTPATGTPQTPVNTPVSAPTIPGIGNLPGGLAGIPGLAQIGNIGQLIPGIAQLGSFDITTLLAQAMAILPAGGAGTTLPQLDKILAAVGLSAQAGANQQSAGTPVKKLGTLTALAGPLLGNTGLGGLGGLSTLAGLGGGFSAGGIQDIINKLSGSVTATGQVPQFPAGLPDFSQLLGLVGPATTNADLIKNLLGSAQVVNGNFNGTSQAALLSMLKVGYSQAFAQMNGTK